MNTSVYVTISVANNLAAKSTECKRKLFLRRRHSQQRCPIHLETLRVELLAPRVQHTEETNFRTEVSRIPRYFLKRFRSGAKLEIVEDLFVLQNQWQRLGEVCPAADEEAWENRD